MGHEKVPVMRWSLWKSEKNLGPVFVEKLSSVKMNVLISECPLLKVLYTISKVTYFPLIHENTPSCFFRPAFKVAEDGLNILLAIVRSGNAQSLVDLDESFYTVLSLNQFSHRATELSHSTQKCGTDS